MHSRGPVSFNHHAHGYLGINHPITRDAIFCLVQLQKEVFRRFRPGPVSRNCRKVRDDMEREKIREQVIEELKAYPDLKRKVLLLRYEQEHPARISDSEVIDSMALSRPVSNGIRSSGFISDKTMRIASQFRDEKERLNQGTLMEITQELCGIENKISKLEFYISQLEDDQAEVIRKYYFERKTWGELQQELHLSPRTLIKRRNGGLDALVSIYEYIGEVKRGTKS